MLRQAYSGTQNIFDQSTIDVLDNLKDKGWMWDDNRELFEEKAKFLKKWCIENNSVNPPKAMCSGNYRTYSNTSKSRSSIFATLPRTLEHFIDSQSIETIQSTMTTSAHQPEKSAT